MPLAAASIRSPQLQSRSFRQALNRDRTAQQTPRKNGNGYPYSIARVTIDANDCVETNRRHLAGPFHTHRRACSIPPAVGSRHPGF